MWHMHAGSTVTPVLFYDSWGWFGAGRIGNEVLCIMKPYSLCAGCAVALCC